jgi:predicted MFS family arabinose efflux permease
MGTSTSYVALLRANRDFRLMWVGQFISLLGDSFNSVATIGLALAITGGSGLSVGLMLALRTVPRLLFSNVAGVWADRHDRRRLLITLDLLLAVATLGYLLVRRPSHLWLLYMLSMLMGALAAAFGTVRGAFVPDVVGKEVLVTATGLTQMSFGLATLLGCALGGLAIAAVGRDAAFVINAASFALSAICTWLVQTRIETDVTGTPQQSCSFRRDLTESARYLRNHPFLAGMIAVDALWTLGGGGVFVILAVLNRARFGGGDETMGLLYAMAGLGGLLAATLRPLIGRRWKLDLAWMGISCVLDGVTFGLVVLSPWLWLAAALLALRSTISWTFSLVYSPLLMQSIDDEMRGRVLGLDYSAVFTMSGVANLVYGALLTAMSPMAVGWISGGMMALPGVAWLAALATGRLPDAPPVTIEAIGTIPEQRATNAETA